MPSHAHHFSNTLADLVQGNVRLLKYTGNDTQDLYFTTSLHNSVQAFSIKNLELLAAQDRHPSPPTVFALSFDSHFLLSTSHQPPTIYLRNLYTKSSPVHVRPSCSSSAVVAANFHPETSGIFVLAFSDGAVAVYDATHILRRDGTARHYSAGSAIATNELASVKRLHTPTTKSLSEVELGLNALTKAEASTTVTGHVSGVSSVALLPGHRAMAVTVGSDGKCCVVDFSQPNKKKAVLLRSWHLRRPATSLSIVLTRKPKGMGQFDGTADATTPSNKDYCIAVGRQDGKVLLFDLDGTTLGAKVLDPQRGRIVDVDWAKKEIDAAFAERQNGTGVATDHSNSHGRRQRKVSNRKGKGATSRRLSDEKAPFDLSTTSRTYQETPLVAALRNPREVEAAKSRQSREKLPLFFAPQADKPLEKLDLKHRHSPLKLELPSPIDSAATGSIGGNGRAIKPLVPPMIESDASPRQALSGTSTPPLPPRPSAKPGGRLHTRRALKALEAAGHDVGPLAAARQISCGSTIATRSSSRRVSMAAIPKRNVVLPLRIPSQKLPAPASIPSTALPPRVNGSFDLEEYKTAPSSGSLSVVESESDAASSDTVIEWGTTSRGQNRYSTPTVLRKPTYRVSPEPSKKVGTGKKGHVSLTVSSSEGEGERISSPLSSSATTVVVDAGKILPARAQDMKVGRSRNFGGGNAVAERTEEDGNVTTIRLEPFLTATSHPGSDTLGQPIKDVKRDSGIVTSTATTIQRTQSTRADVIEDSDGNAEPKPQPPVKHDLGFAKSHSPASWLSPPGKKREASPKRKPVPTSPPREVKAIENVAAADEHHERSESLERRRDGTEAGDTKGFLPDNEPPNGIEFPKLEPKSESEESLQISGFKTELFEYLDRKFEEVRKEVSDGFEAQRVWIERESERKAEEVVLLGGTRARSGTGLGSSDEKRKGSVFGREREVRMRGVGSSGE